MDVTLETATLLVLGGDETLPRQLQLRGAQGQLVSTRRKVRAQPDQPQHQPRLRSQPSEQTLFHCRQRDAVLLLQPEDPVDPAAMAHRQSPATVTGQVPRARCWFRRLSDTELRRP